MEIDLGEPTRPQIAAVLGVSSRWVGELRAKGTLPSDGASLLENIEAWGQMKYGSEDEADPNDLDAQRARLACAQADAKEMDNAERRKELASRSDMMIAVTGLIAISVSRLMQVPAAVAKGDHKLRVRIETAMVDALEDLSVTRVEETIGGGIDEEEAAPEKEE